MTENHGKAVWPGWETVRLIGRGTFGAVYEIGRDVFGHREKAALKVISIPQSDGDIEELISEGYDEESITKRFEGYLQDIVREYSMMADMKGCANIIYCDDVRYIQHDDGMGWDIFIKMEFLTSLPKALGKTIPEEQVVRIGRDICSALIFCEQRNVIHRDIKPQNIFVAPDGTYKLGDFGIAKTAERTTSGTKTGTYKYMAPEVYNSRPYGGKADIYSLGLVLYWLLNERRTPFLPLPPQTPTNSDEDDARQRRFRGEKLPAPLHGSKELKRIVLKACAYDPVDRYRNAEEMLRDLETLGKGEPPRPVLQKAEEAPRRVLPEPVGAEENPLTEGLFLKGQKADTPDANAVLEEEGTVGFFHGGPLEKNDTPQREAQTPQQPASGGWEMLPQSLDQPPTKKKKRGWIWGIAAAAVVICLIVLILLNPFSTPPTCELDADGCLTIRCRGEVTNTVYEALGISQLDIRAVVLEGKVTGIGAHAFENCNNLSRIQIPASVQSIGPRAFARCTSLTNVSIPSDVRSIGEYAFAWCSALTEVALPSGETDIGQYAFSYCTSLNSIAIPNGVKSIREYTFEECSSLTSVMIPTSVQSIGPNAFSHCVCLESVTIPDGVTDIGYSAFLFCSRLKDATIPASVTSGGLRAFYGCSKLHDVTYGGTQGMWDQYELSMMFDSDPTIHFHG